MKRIQALMIATLVCLGMVSNSHAIVSCKIEVEDNNNNVIASFTAQRGIQFGNRKVKKLYDCDTCWNGGKTLGPQSGYCGTNNNAGDEYIISCVKNSGAKKTKTYPCP